MKKAVLCMALVAAFVTMLCGVSYSASDAECGPCKKFTKCIGETFTFDATKSCANTCGPCAPRLCYRWDFGDGCTAEGACVTHCYENSGEYMVKLTVTDDSGLPCDSDSITQMVKVNCPPKAIFTGPDCACCGMEVTYDGSGSSSETSKVLNYNWCFSDGATYDGPIAKHTFTCGGCQKVMLTVDDGSCSNCCVDTACMDVRVNTAPCVDAGNDICLTCIPQGQDFCVNLKACGSDAEGDCLTYMWNFGDGSSAEGQCVSHTYADPGNYKVTVVASDGCNSPCSTGSDCLTVYCSRQPCAEAGVEHVICVNTQAEFDGSKSVAGPGANYIWDFGDGEKANGVRASHAYDAGGHYEVTLTVEDGECCSYDSTCVKVNAGPVAALCGPEEACTGENISFNATGSCDPDGDCITYNWDFGDGTTCANGGPKVCHMYEKGGKYTITVSVDDGMGLPCSAHSASTSVTINGRPTAVIAPCDACCVGKEILWDGSASSDPDGDALKYSWDFGDGATAEGAKATHVYTANGNYKVTLKVDDGKGTPCSVNYSMYTACIHEGPKADLCVN
ncbi:MAG: PKD domain-containing protein [Candidatus Omnitrophica bacterium]|nr:PKD domain-containing protein [Candidatus Omnitrophota bacterium]